MRILICGEALVDLVPVPDEGAEARAGVPGGSPLNVAVGLARLGVPTGFLGKISTDRHGTMLFDHLAGNGVDARYVVRGSEPTTLARVEETTEGEPEYTFAVEGAADSSLCVDELPDELPDEIAAVHCGSYSMVLEPVGTALTTLMEREQARRVVTFDPNVRPALIRDWPGYRASFERWVSLSHVVKLSATDFGLVCPDENIERAAERWLSGTTRLVVVTRGASGAVAYASRLRVEAGGESVKIRDTVGAGDAFMSGLLAWLDDRRWLRPAVLPGLGGSDLRAAVEFANRVAAVTCARRGADPPTRDQLSRSPDERPVYSIRRRDVDESGSSARSS